MIRWGLIAFGLLTAPAWGAAAAEDPAALAREASAMLAEAAGDLTVAEKAPDRIAALTRTVRAYEAGLSAMREGLRRAALEERGLRTRLDGERARISEVLTLLTAVSRAPEAQAELHPGGAPDTVRAGILAAAMVRGLHEKSDALKADLDALGAVTALQRAGMKTLDGGLGQVREARLALSEAMENRAGLPPEIATDTAAMQALIDSTETLQSFADSLVPKPVAAPAGETGASWPMPVRGAVVGRFNKAGPDGVRRPGWTVRTAPEALVTAPAPATLLFAGTMPGHREVAILETAPGQMLILAGLGRLFVKRGAIVAGGDPIGLMGGGQLGSLADEQQKLIETATEGGHPPAETLYMELRQARTPLDPAGYMRLSVQ